MSDLLDCVIIEPTAPHSGTVLWLHGLGASGHDFEPVAPWLRRPDLRFVFPHAPQRPVTINQGWVMPAWYDIKTLAPGPGREDPADIAEATGMIEGLLAREVAALAAAGVSEPTARVALLGFSQGAAMSLHVGLRHGERLAGIGVLSGYLLLEDTIETEASDANTKTSVFFGHGARDGVVRVARGREAHGRVGALGHPTVWVERPRMQHEVDAEEIAALGTWLSEVLPA